MSPPIYTPDGSEVTEVVLPDGSTASEVVAPDGTVVFDAGPDIPDSEANQKLIHRWYLSEDSAPFVDQIGGADSTSVTGTTQVTGDWVDGAAREGDGVDDIIETTTLGSFGSSLGGDFAIAFSINYSTTPDRDIIGLLNDTSDTGIAIPLRSGGEIGFFLRDDNLNDYTVETDSAFNDGNNHRVVINKTGQDAGDLSFWIDQTDVAESIDSANSNPLDSFSDLEHKLPFFGRNNRGSIDVHTAGILDDICFFSESLTSTEIQSYQNPWQ